MVFNISELEVFSSSNRNGIRSIVVGKKKTTNQTVKVDIVLI